jgi:hypothetical protein
MDYTSAIAELLSRHGFRRFMMSRTQVGHLTVVGQLEPIRAVLGQDVLRSHRAVIDYGALAIFLKEESA